MKLIIAGPRDLEIYDAVIEEALRHFDLKPNMIITGGARGVDTAAYFYAVRNGFQTVEVKANWSYYGRYAGPKRNNAMARLGDALLIIKRKDVDTPGTTSMRKMARLYEIPVYVFELERGEELEPEDAGT